MLPLCCCENGTSGSVSMPYYHEISLHSCCSWDGCSLVSSAASEHLCGKAENTQSLFFLYVGARFTSTQAKLLHILHLFFQWQQLQNWAYWEFVIRSGYKGAGVDRSLQRQCEALPPNLCPCHSYCILPVKICRPPPQLRKLWRQPPGGYALPTFIVNVFLLVLISRSKRVTMESQKKRIR